ncbi:hypothetical protein KCU67_g1866, partial [Aureobasidium melanogenum]
MKTVTKQKTATEQRTVTRQITMTKLETVTKQSRAESTALNELENRQTVAPCRAEMSVQFTEPYHFCVFYNAYPRTTSPFAEYSARELIKLCKNVVKNHVKKLVGIQNFCGGVTHKDCTENLIKSHIESHIQIFEGEYVNHKTIVQVYIQIIIKAYIKDILKNSLANLLVFLGNIYQIVFEVEAKYLFGDFDYIKKELKPHVKKYRFNLQVPFIQPVGVSTTRSFFLRIEVVHFLRIRIDIGFYIWIQHHSDSVAHGTVFFFRDTNTVFYERVAIVYHQELNPVHHSGNFVLTVLLEHYVFDWVRDFNHDWNVNFLRSQLFAHDIYRVNPSRSYLRQRSASPNRYQSAMKQTRGHNKGPAAAQPAGQPDQQYKSDMKRIMQTAEGFRPNGSISVV